MSGSRFQVESFSDLPKASMDKHNVFAASSGEATPLPRLTDHLATLLGGPLLATGVLAHLFVRRMASSEAWILPLLVAKPFLDLMWQWSFGEYHGQPINIQTLVGLFALLLNGIVLLGRPRDRHLPSLVLVFMALACISLAFTFTSEGLNELLRLLAGVTFFFSAGRLLADQRRFDRFAKALVLVSAIPVFLSFLQLIGLIPYYYWDWINGAPIGRVSGAYPTPLSLVYLLIYAYPLALYLTGSRRSSFALRIWAWIFLATASIALVFTYHRATYIVITMQVLLWFYWTRGKRVVIVAAVALCLVTIAFSHSLTAIFEQAVLSDSGAVDENLLRGRGFQWALFLGAFYNSTPFHWVIGNGGSVIADLDPNLTYVLDPQEPHNDFIRVLHAYGIAGLGAYLAILIVFARKARHHLRSSDEFAKGIGRVMLLILLAVCLLSMTTEPLRYPSGVWYLFALGAVLFFVTSDAGYECKNKEG